MKVDSVYTIVKIVKERNGDVVGVVYGCVSKIDDVIPCYCDCVNESCVQKLQGQISNIGGVHTHA